MARRFYSVLFLTLILFNITGYYCLFIADKHKSDRFSSIIEGNANEISGNLIFKIPMDFPNASIAQNFKPVDGEIIYEGEVYRLVKQNLYKDTLFVVCMKDAERKEIRQALHDYAESFTDHPVNTNTNAGQKIFSLLTKDYISVSHCIQHAIHGWSRILDFKSSESFYKFNNIAFIFHPPQ